MNPFNASPCPLYCSVLIVVCVFTNLISSQNITTESAGDAMSKLFYSLTNEKVYNKNIRPYYGEKPVKVEIVVYVSDIYSVSDSNMEFTAVLDIVQFWRDPRLAFTPANNLTDELVLTSDFEKLIWLPNTYIDNSKSLSPTMSFSNRILSDFYIKSTGDVNYATLLTATVNCPMNLRYFPVDKQTCELDIDSSYYAKDVDFNWASKERLQEDDKSFSINPNVSLPTFILKSYTTGTYEDTLFRGTYKQLTCSLHFERSLGYYLNQIYVPSFLIVVISWIPFWLNRDHHARVGLGVTTVLTITTLISNTNESLPKVSYIKAIDVYLFVCFLMVFLALIEFAAIGWVESHEQWSSSSLLPDTNDDHVTVKLDDKSVESKSKSSKKKKRKMNNNKRDKMRDTAWIDKMSRVLFPTVFITFNFVYAGTLIYIKHFY